MHVRHPDARPAAADEGADAARAGRVGGARGGDDLGGGPGGGGGRGADARVELRVLLLVAATYLDREAPPHLRASAQGIITFVSGGVGVWAGNVFAGLVVDHHRAGTVIDWRPVWLVPLVGSVGGAGRVRPVLPATPGPEHFGKLRDGPCTRKYVMARFFKYKSVAELEAENARLGIDLRFSRRPRAAVPPGRDRRPRRPATAGASTRWRAATASPTGAPGELTFRRYSRFGAGGAKVIWGEACAVVEEGRANPRQIVAQRATRRPTSPGMVADCRKAHRDANGDDADLLVRPATDPLRPVQLPPADHRHARPAARRPVQGDAPTRRSSPTTS